MPVSTLKLHQNKISITLFFPLNCLGRPGCPCNNLSASDTSNVGKINKRLSILLGFPRFGS